MAGPLSSSGCFSMAPTMASLLAPTVRSAIAVRQMQPSWACCCVPPERAESGKMDSSHPTPKLDGKVAVIKGASKVGEAIATKFATSGARVILADKKFYECKAAVANVNEELKTAGVTQQVKAMEWDVVKEPHQNIQEAIKLAKETNNSPDRLDIFCNHAWFNLSDDGSSSVSNVAAVLKSIKHAGDAMSSRDNPKGGLCLCVGSTMGLLGDVVPSAYSVSMSALMVAIRDTAAELSSKNVRVNAISPRCVEDNTSFHEGVLLRILQQILPDADDDKRRGWINTYAGKRVVGADDVANAAVFLASDDGKSVNGHNLVLSGRFTL